MILDLTRKPLLVFPDEVTDSVVVRSIGNRSVSGLVTFKYERRWGKPKTISLDPGAALTRGDSTCFETRLLLPGSQAKESPYDFTHDYQDNFLGYQGMDRSKEEQTKILPEPFEIASAYKDPITNFSGTWRIGVRVEKHKNGKTWLVSVNDITQGTIFCTIAARSLDPNPEYKEPLPLNRATRNVVSGTAWDRIMGDD